MKITRTKKSMIVRLDGYSKFYRAYMAGSRTGTVIIPNKIADDLGFYEDGNIDMIHLHQLMDDRLQVSCGGVIIRGNGIRWLNKGIIS